MNVHENSLAQEGEEPRRRREEQAALIALNDADFRIVCAVRCVPDAQRLTSVIIYMLNR